MKATIKSIMVLAAALAMVACGGSKKLTKEQIIEYGEIAYSGIVSYIVQGYQSNWVLMDPAAEMNLSPVYSYSSPYAGFAQQDIDGDGFDELLIGDQFEDGSYALYDIYRFSPKDATLSHLASGGERDRYTITSDGVIVESGSNSASDSFEKGFKIEDNSLVELKDQSWEESLMAVSLEKFSDLAKPQMFAGGYTEQREPTEEEVEMFKAVTSDCDIVLSPLSVSTQVVAGLNYRFWCRYQQGDESGHCWVTIYKPLPGQGDPRLTSIDKEQ